MKTRIYRDYRQFERTAPGPPALAIGNFDGIHLGHARIFEALRLQAAKLAGDAVIFTFNPHPAQLVCKQAPFVISPQGQSRKLIQSHGVDVVIEQKFTPEFAQMDPSHFVEMVLHQGLDVGVVLVGEDFRFGKDRSGDAALLASLCADRKIGVHALPLVAVDGVDVSSTHIRGLIRGGQVEQASRFLGRPYRLSGVVVRGAGRGRQLGIPTANVQPESTLLPARGVYACRGRIDNRLPHWDGVLNVGSNPTFGASGLGVEVHFPGFVDQDLYGAHLDLDILCRLRDEVVFPNPEELCRQILRDIDLARQCLEPGTNSRQ